jgi:hypothetical protein
MTRAQYKRAWLAWYCKHKRPQRAKIIQLMSELRKAGISWRVAARAVRNLVE